MASVASDAVLDSRRHATRPYRLYVLGLLVLVGACSWIDRQVLAIVLQNIKAELHLTDTQLGLLGGTAFGIFYVTIGLPVAWLADRYNRLHIIALATALWSAATAWCSVATGFGTFFLCRMGVGIGEAGGAAPSQSLVSDYFPARRRALALGILYSYIPIGYFVAYAIGGWLNDTVGWRKSFLLFGIPGLVLALLVKLTVREPARGLADNLPVVQQVPAFLATLRYFLGRAPLRHLPLAGAAHATGMVGAAIWLPAYFIRTHHMTSTSVGLQLALVMGVAGMVGTLGGGHLVDRLIARTGDARWSPWSCAIFLGLSVPFTIAVFTVSDPEVALLLYIVPTIFNHMTLGPVMACVQNLAGVTRRAMAAAFYLFMVNLLASGLGPLLVGALSDTFQVRFGENSLRYSLLFLIPSMSSWATVHFFIAGRTMRRDEDGWTA